MLVNYNMYSPCYFTSLPLCPKTSSKEGRPLGFGDARARQEILKGWGKARIASQSSSRADTLAMKNLSNGRLSIR